MKCPKKILALFGILLTAIGGLVLSSFIQASISYWRLRLFWALGLDL